MAQAIIQCPYSYDVFGAIRTQSGTSTNQWLFTGEQRDGDSSLYYLRARYYDPASGRFLSQDALPTGNLYAYAGNNPVAYVDPYGTDICSTIGGLFGSNKGCKDTAKAVVNVAVDAGCSGTQVILCGYVGLGPLGDSYFDYNLTVGCGRFVFTGGFQYSAHQGLHPYAGGGGGNCTFTGSADIGYNQEITPGSNCGVQIGYVFETPWGPIGPTAQYGGGSFDYEGHLDFKRSSPQEFWEVGIAVGTPGRSYAGTCYRVFSVPYLSW